MAYTEYIVSSLLITILSRTAMICPILVIFLRKSRNWKDRVKMNQKPKLLSK
jgi:hypothetical protein